MLMNYIVAALPTPEIILVVVKAMLRHDAPAQMIRDVIADMEAMEEQQRQHFIERQAEQEQLMKMAFGQ